MDEVVTVVFDFDGVIGDTEAIAVEAANHILELLDPGAEPFPDRKAFRQRLNLARLRASYGVTAAETISDLHPLLVRLASERKAPPVFPGVVGVARKLALSPPIVTAGYEHAVRAALGHELNAFGPVYGRESGDKTELLRKHCARGAILVTDTVTDVERCRYLGLTAVAVSWGYDSAEQLLEAGAVEAVDSAEALLGALVSLGAIA